LRIGNRTIGVLDLDSPMVERFDAEDRAGCEALARIFLEALNGNPAAQTTLTSA
jgi:L-methionine (R)-S-oxide reductase